MKAKKLIKPLAKLVMGKEATKRAFHEPASRAQLHAFWRNPDGENQPEDYRDAGPARTLYLLDIVRAHLPTDATMLEIGCNAGRNLKGLWDAGYRNLSAIEINPKAVAVLRASFPELAQAATIHNAPVEEVLPTLPDGGYDGIFSMAVLEHIHPDSDWIFADIARLVRSTLITIEDERNTAFANVPRDYRKVFERHGLKQVECRDAADVDGLCSGFYARVFKRA